MMSIVTIMMLVQTIDVTVTQVALTVILSVTIIMLVPMIVVIHNLVVFTVQKLVMMEILVLMTLVVLLRDVYTLKKFATTTIFVPPIPAMLKLAFVNMCQQTAMMVITVPLKNVVYKLVNVYILL
jgi:hypothetical protein